MGKQHTKIILNILFCTLYDQKAQNAQHAKLHNGKLQGMSHCIAHRRPTDRPSLAAAVTAAQTQQQIGSDSAAPDPHRRARAVGEQWH